MNVKTVTVTYPAFNVGALLSEWISQPNAIILVIQCATEERSCAIGGKNVAAPFPPPSTIFPANAKPPFRLGQLFVDGGTLAFLIRIAGHQIIVFGSMDYNEREVDGLRPDVALIGAMPERQKVYHYTDR